MNTLLVNSYYPPPTQSPFTNQSCLAQFKLRRSASRRYWVGKCSKLFPSASGSSWGVSALSKRFVLCEQQVSLWQTNKIFVIAYISLQKPPSLDVSWLLALFSFLLSCRKPTQISVTLHRFSGKWCSNWCSDCDCFNLIFSAVPVRQTL